MASEVEPQRTSAKTDDASTTHWTNTYLHLHARSLNWNPCKMIIFVINWLVFPQQPMMEGKLWQDVGAGTRKRRDVHEEQANLAWYHSDQTQSLGSINHQALTKLSVGWKWFCEHMRWEFEMLEVELGLWGDTNLRTFLRGFVLSNSRNNHSWTLYYQITSNPTKLKNSAVGEGKPRKILLLQGPNVGIDTIACFRQSDFEVMLRRKRDEEGRAPTTLT